MTAREQIAEIFVGNWREVEIHRLLDAIEAEAVARYRRVADAETVCVWTYHEGEGSWDGQCGAKWVFETGGPTANKVRHCFECGRPVKVAEPCQTCGGSGEVRWPNEVGLRSIPVDCPSCQPPATAKGEK